MSSPDANPAIANMYRDPNMFKASSPVEAAYRAARTTASKGFGTGTMTISPQSLAQMTPEGAAFAQAMSDEDRTQQQAAINERAVGLANPDLNTLMGEPGLPADYWRNANALEEQRVEGDHKEQLDRLREKAIAGGWRNSAAYDEEVRRLETSRQKELSTSRLNLNMQQANMIREDRWNKAQLTVRAGGTAADILTKRELPQQNLLDTYDWLKANGSGGAAGGTAAGGTAAGGASSRGSASYVYTGGKDVGTLAYAPGDPQLGRSGFLVGDIHASNFPGADTPQVTLPRIGRPTPNSVPAYQTMGGPVVGVRQYQGGMTERQTIAPGSTLPKGFWDVPQGTTSSYSVYQGGRRNILGY